MTRGHFEELLVEGVQWIRLLAEATGAIIVAIGVALALWLYLRSALSRQHANFNGIRLVLARYLALALEFQLGSDILSTAINPTGQQIGQLAAIAVIRTGLNYFLGKEIKEEQAAEQEAARNSADSDTIHAVTR